MRIRVIAFTFAVISFSALMGCGGPVDKTIRKKTHPVTGTVTLNKQPTGGILVTLYPANEADRSGDFWNQGFPAALSKDDGTFKFGTYGKEDGAPVGDYLVIAVKMEGDGEKAKDVLKGRYANPAKAFQKFQVKEEPNTLTVTLK